MIDFSCDKCGKRFQLKPEFAGRTTTCTGCKQPLSVPLSTPVPLAPGSQIDKIAFSCSKCGMKFSLKAEFAGRSTKCPTCKESLIVPSPDQTQALSLPSGKLAGTASSLAQAGMDGGVTLAGDGPADAGRDTLQHLMDGKANDGERYVIEGEIARGGMGAVLRAVDCDIRREVAVKYLLDQVDKKKKLRFVEEAQITGQLEHPNIVPIHELGVDSLKRVFFSMKMVKGRSLAQILDLFRKEPRQAAREYSLGKLLGIFNSICNALAYAHSRGVVHRDIKPANIMVGDFGEVYVMDWGLAKIIKRDLTSVEGTGAIPDATFADPSATAASPFDFTTEAPLATAMSATSASASGTTSSSQVVTSRELDADLTQEGAVMGTPVYMPPEQAAGKIHEIDERSDIYAMGAILYEMLTLQPPISKEGGYWPVLMRVTQGKIDPPEVKAPERARAGQIPPELAAVAMKALAKEKDDRYPTIEKLRSDIELFLEGRSVSAKEDTRKEMVIKFVKRNRAFSAVSASAAAVLMCVISWALVANFSERRKTQKAYDDYAREQQLKEERTRKAVPALVEIARRDAEGRNFKKALEQVRLALEYDAKHDDARLLYAQLQIVNKNFAAGSTELATYLAKRYSDRKSTALKRWCDKANADPKDHGAIMQISQVLIDQKNPGMAEGFLSLYAKTGEEFRSELLNLYRKRIEAAWPGAGPHLSIDKDGNFHMNAHPGDAKDLSPLKGIPLKSLTVHGQQLRDLSALQGMPLNRLEIQSIMELQNLNDLKGLELESFTAQECQKLSDMSGLSGMPLKSINLLRVPVANLSALKGMPLTNASINVCAVADLSGLKELPLESLELGQNPIRDLSPLKGLKLKTLDLQNSGGLRDLTPLKGMPLTSLNLTNCGIVQDLSPLQGMPLAHLDLTNCTEVRSLEPLRGLPLTSLTLRGCGLLPNLKGIEGMRLTSLDLAGCARISDISAVQNMPLININLGGCTAMTDLSPLKGKPFTQLDLTGFVKLTDLTPLKGMPLTQLKLNNCTELVDLSPLRGIPLHHLELNGCVKVTDLTPLKESVIQNFWMQGCSSLKNLDGLQGQRFHKIELNGCTSLENLDGLAGVPIHHFQMDNCPKITNLNILKPMPLNQCTISNCEGLTDISGLGGKRHFGSLSFHNCPNIEDWTPIRGVSIQDFAVGNCRKFHDLSVLQSMGGRSINVTQCGKVVDFTPLKDITTLSNLTLVGCKELDDLSPLKGLKLIHLNLDNSCVKDLSPIRGMALQSISLMKCEELTDLTPLSAMPLQHIQMPPRITKGIDELRRMKTLQNIDQRPAQQFWQQWDASQPKTK